MGYDLSGEAVMVGFSLQAQHLFNSLTCTRLSNGRFLRWRTLLSGFE